MGEVAFRCLPHRQLWMSNLSKVATQWFEVYSNLLPSGCEAQNIGLLLHHRVPRLLRSVLQSIDIGASASEPVLDVWAKGRLGAGACAIEILDVGQSSNVKFNAITRTHYFHGPNFYFR